MQEMQQIPYSQLLSKLHNIPKLLHYGSTLIL